MVGCGSKESTNDSDRLTDDDIGFLIDMSFHHGQALVLCQRVLGRDTGGPVQASAAEILQYQSYELGVMHAWLQAEDASTAPPEEVMAWMGMPLRADEMPGLASPAEIDELENLDGRAKGRRFLELMRAHHVGALHMLEAIADTPTDRVASLAGRMMTAQTFDIAVFDELLATSYAAS
ncbi:MAG: DUF305 domain-containing protein [Ilumatobacteraceae bacterium]